MKRHMLVYLVGLAMSSSLGAAEAQSANPAVAKPGSATIDPHALSAVGVHANSGSDGAAQRQSQTNTAPPGSAVRERQDMTKASALPRASASNAAGRAAVGAAHATAPGLDQGSAMVARPTPEKTSMNALAMRAAPALTAERALSGPVAALEQPRSSMAIGAHTNAARLAELTPSRATDASQGALSSMAVGAPTAQNNAARVAELAPSRAIDANQDMRSSMAIKAHTEPGKPSKLLASGAARRAPLAAALYGPIVHARPAWKR